MWVRPQVACSTYQLGESNIQVPNDPTPSAVRPLKVPSTLWDLCKPPSSNPFDQEKKYKNKRRKQTGGKETPIRRAPRKSATMKMAFGARLGASFVIVVCIRVCLVVEARRPLFGCFEGQHEGNRPQKQTGVLHRQPTNDV